MARTDAMPRRRRRRARCERGRAGWTARSARPPGFGLSAASGNMAAPDRETLARAGRKACTTTGTHGAGATASQDIWYTCLLLCRMVTVTRAVGSLAVLGRVELTASSPTVCTVTRWVQVE